jgi:hypothetical protein
MVGNVQRRLRLSRPGSYKLKVAINPLGRLVNLATISYFVIVVQHGL